MALAAISTPGCLPSRLWPRDGAPSRWICRDMADRPRKSAPAMPRAWPMRSRVRWRARHRAGSSGRTLDGRRDRGARGVAAARARRVLTLIASAGLGPEINAPFIDGFVRRRAAARRSRCSAFWSTTRADQPGDGRGCPALQAARRGPPALTKIAAAWFAGGRQPLDLTGRIAALTMPVQLIWGRDDRIIPAAHAEALAARFPCTSSKPPAICRTWKKPARSMG